MSVYVAGRIYPNAHVRLLTWLSPNADPVELAKADSNRSVHADITAQLGIGDYYIEVSSITPDPEDSNRLYQMELSQTLPAKTKPFILKPLEHVSVAAGKPAEFSVLAEGSDTISYQWYFDGAPIPNATQARLQFGSVKASDAGSYTVTATSEFSSVTSTSATMTVIPASLPLDIAQAVIISWPVTSEGSDLSQWILEDASSLEGPWHPAAPVVRSIANERVYFAVPVQNSNLVVFRLRRL